VVAEPAESQVEIAASAAALEAGAETASKFVGQTAETGFAETGLPATVVEAAVFDAVVAEHAAAVAIS
jgi:hypothetical protein